MAGPARSSSAAAVRHGLSFDVECYTQIVAKDYLGERRAPTVEVERNTTWILDLLAARSVTATFFTLGNVAVAYPGLIRRMVAEGHEVGVHGHDHLYLTRLTRASFRDELRRALGALRQAGATEVRGHRAPAFSLVASTLWALDVMAESGLTYDSSIYPLRARRYGVAAPPRLAHRLANGLVEVPMTVVDCGGRALPAAGGGYARVFPYLYTRWALRACEAEGRPAIVYFHPHEFEPSRPSVAAPGSALLALRLKLARFNALQAIGRGEACRRKLERLLTEFRFRPLRDIAAEVA